MRQDQVMQAYARGWRPYRPQARGGQSPLPEPSVPVPAIELPWQAKLEPPFQCPNTQASSLDCPDICPLAQQRIAEGDAERELEFD